MKTRRQIFEELQALESLVLTPSAFREAESYTFRKLVKAYPRHYFQLIENNRQRLPVSNHARLMRWYRKLCLELDGSRKRFLDYDQLCELGEEYGFISLTYERTEHTLKLFEWDSRFGKEAVFTEQDVLPGKTDKEILTEFLLNFFSYPGNFAGYPFFVSSALFTSVEINDLIDAGVRAITERRAKSKRNALVSELVIFCRDNALNPQPEGSNTSNWYANCPFGSGHFIMVCALTNTWGCGYCRKKGGLQELKEWVHAKKKA